MRSFSSAMGSEVPVGQAAEPAGASEQSLAGDDFTEVLEKLWKSRIPNGASSKADLVRRPCQTGEQGSPPALPHLPWRQSGTFRHRCGRPSGRGGGKIILVKIEAGGLAFLSGMNYVLSP